MAYEIERKFLVKCERWRKGADQGVLIRQCYLSDKGKISLRVRIKDERATLTIKSADTALRRHEFEYEIPLDDAAELMELRQGAVVEKRRHYIPWHGLTFEIDVFQGENSGLVIAEIELPEENHAFEQPEWLGEEITANPRYSNAELALHPFSSWPVSMQRGSA